MKKRINLSLWILVIIMIAVMMACGGDDSNGGVSDGGPRLKFTKEMIVTPTCYGLVDYTVERGDDPKLYKDTYMFFENDGTCKGLFRGNEKRYSINNGILETYDYETGAIMYKYTLLDITSTTMKACVESSLYNGLKATLYFTKKTLDIYDPNTATYGPLTITPSGSFKVGDSAGTVTVKVSTNPNVSWFVLSNIYNDIQCSVSPTSGKGDGVVYINYSARKSNKSESAIIIFSYKDYSKTEQNETVTISRKAIGY